MNPSQNMSLSNPSNISLSDPSQNISLSDPSHDYSQIDFSLKPCGLKRGCSAQYRSSSLMERQITENIVDNYKEQAQKLMKLSDINYEQAMQQLDPNYEEHQWTMLSLHEQDLEIGEVIYSTKPPIIACNSKLNKLFNDTIAITDNDELTYTSIKTSLGSHSGDIHTNFGLRHTIKLNPDCDKDIYIISSPWQNAKSKPIQMLQSTNPTLEVRTFEEGKMTRRVIAADYSIGNEHTAFLNLKISRDKEHNLWKIEIIFKFLRNGFADDITNLRISINE
jgi:hypothetical protein